ncbi:hypothetical protein, partial [Escherichia coli]
SHRALSEHKTLSISWSHYREFRLMYLHNKNNMRHFCITNKKKQKTSIFIFGQWVFWPIVVIVLLVIIFILPAYWSVINFDQL